MKQKKKVTEESGANLQNNEWLDDDDESSNLSDGDIDDDDDEIDETKPEAIGVG